MHNDVSGNYGKLPEIVSCVYNKGQNMLIIYYLPTVKSFELAVIYDNYLHFGSAHAVPIMGFEKNALKD